MNKINWKFKDLNLKSNIKNKYDRTFFYQALFVVILGIGIYARFKGLGKWPLAVDEYYIAKSVNNILEQTL